MTMETPKADTDYGVMDLPDDPEDLIARCLIATGAWGAVETEICGTLMKPGGVLYDVGAYLGTFSLGVARQCPSLGRIVAIEPTAASFDLLARNLSRNCVIEYHTVNAAVGKTAGRSAAGGSNQLHNIGSTFYRPADGGKDPATTVNCMTLGQLRQKFGDYDFLKLDVEGGEFDALCGDAQWIRNRKPPVWAECNEAPGVNELLGFFLWAGLAPVYVAFPAIRRVAGTPPFPQAYEAALLGGVADAIDRLKALRDRHELIVNPIANLADLRRAMWQTLRWSRAAWGSLNRAELMGLLGRAERSEKLEDFLIE